jgi:hypothetical protein
LAPSGLLLVSFIGERTPVPEAGDWEEDRTGMNVLDGGLHYREGGAIVLHSQWWMRAHWGRAFEILRLEAPAGAQGWVLMRKRPVSITACALEAVEREESREISALRRNIEQLELRHRTVVLEKQALAGELSELLQSRSWRLTRPLRAARRRIGR